MKKLQHLRDELKDVRLIHFSLVAVSGTILYLVSASWTDSPELSEELVRLKETVANLATTRPKAEHLAVLLDTGWVEKLADDVRKALGDAIGEPLGWGGGGKLAAGTA